MKASTIKVIAILLVLMGLSNIVLDEFLQESHMISPINFLIGILSGMLIANAIIGKQRKFLLVAILLGLLYIIMLSISAIKYFKVMSE